jgi:hypothetical protein
LRGGSGLIIAYLAFGLSLSAAQNLVGCRQRPPIGLRIDRLYSRERDATVLVVLVPAVTWPVDLYWSVYHTTGLGAGR